MSKKIFEAVGARVITVFVTAIASIGMLAILGVISTLALTIALIVAILALISSLFSTPEICLEVEVNDKHRSFKIGPHSS
ncbi:MULTISPECIES: hypothetical protein [unclassified Pseudovibrio]|uniref:hypothetical protein n=1 Tax=unclassified Pseudovibrio TaxID=2627060 RepID=UPI0007AEB9D7|nr:MULTISPECIES: hypothetical protein [unclassified Pseudovibrio]KZK92440.1 hypothetical protein PsW74_05723 [Pseudovibrio sp. W74]KZL06202.1 hypothetical protein PsAD14_04649 [Pseudovibrio sp. Ad14]